MTTLDALREGVCAANLELATSGLARFTFGNASGIDRARNLVCIKPSGMPYESMSPSDMVMVGMDGAIVHGALRPSSDLPTHLVLYRAFPDIGGVVHTHSHYTTVWAQARHEIPCLGTTHADYFRGPIPVTAPLSPNDVTGSYEENTGHAIVRCLGDRDPLEVAAALVSGHGSFCWGTSVPNALHLAHVLEEIARLAYHTAVLDAAVEPIDEVLRERHFLRKHGKTAYYGQDSGT